MNTDRPIQVEPIRSPQGAGLVSTRTARRSLASFTLIELLVVVAVILILFGISLKMMSIVGVKTGTAKTLYVLEQTRNALDAYYATVGTYPNTTEIDYDRFNGGGQSSWIQDISSSIPQRKGLVYYIGFEPNPRASSWQKFAKTVIGSSVTHTNPPIYIGAMSITTTNVVNTIQDAWGNKIIYVPNANCDGYILYSAGPDGNPLTTNDNSGIDKNE